MSKTGGGKGTNQYGVKGVSQAKQQGTDVVVGLATSGTDRQWTKQSAGYWGSLPYVVVNHPRVFPRGWTLIREGREIGRFKTLAAARDEVARLDALPQYSLEHVFND